ncbi:MAG: hypothetical protein R2911_45900 [Caldilineaceae bacterium]
MRSSARGYVLKDTDDLEIARAILAVDNVSNLFGKLQVADQAQAIVKARDAGLK